LEERARSELREPPPEDKLELQSRASPSPPLEDSPEEVVSRESHHSSMMTLDKSLRDSWKVSSETPSPTPSTPEERPSPLWMSSMLLRDKAEPSTVSEVEMINSLVDMLNNFYYFSLFYPFSSLLPKICSSRYPSKSITKFRAINNKL
jgi:hypothetical protein